MTTPPASAHALRPTRVVLDNGLTLLHNQAAANPSAVLRVLLRAGAAREAADEQGLASFTGRMLRQGSQHIDRDALAEELDGMGVGLSIDVGYLLTTGSIKCLSQDVDRAAELLAEVLLRPTFPEEHLERLRGQVLTDVREAADSTRIQAERLWREQVYPPEHRYHRLPLATEQTLQSFNRASVERFHATTYAANQATVVVVGDVSLEHATDLVQRVFGAWRPLELPSIEALVPPGPPPGRSAREFEMPTKSQADVVMGTVTLDRRDPDYQALSFANHVLGRMYFMGRLGEKVRDEQGLAYYAYSDLSAAYGQSPWSVRAGVNPRNLRRALESINAEIERFLADGPTEVEQEDGVRSILGSLPLRLETNEGAAAVMGEIELYDLGLDYLERYPDIIRSLTAQRVLEAARRWLRPEQMVTAIAGPAIPD